jgi:thioredoxin-dependent peroxiredoxin
MTSITFTGNAVHIVGNLPKIGEYAPDFTVTKMDLSEIKLKNYLGKKIILNIFPSLDTQTCAQAMRRFNEIASQFPDILILCISADLPFAQKRFCSAEHLNNVQPVSIFRHPGFGRDYGQRITDGPLTGLLSRAVVIIDEKGQVQYTEQVEELTKEPDYEKILLMIDRKSNAF